VCIEHISARDEISIYVKLVHTLHVGFYDKQPTSIATECESLLALGNIVECCLSENYLLKKLTVVYFHVGAVAGGLVEVQFVTSVARNWLVSGGRVQKR